MRGHCTNYLLYCTNLFVMCNDHIHFLTYTNIYCTGGLVVEREFTQWMRGCRFDPRTCHIKDVIKMALDASLLSTEHIRIGMASLSFQTLFKTNEMDSFWTERSRVITISWNNLLRNWPSISRYKLTYEGKTLS